MSAVFRCTWPMSTPGSIGRSACAAGVTGVSFIRTLYLIAQLSVEWPPALREHLDEARDPARARLRALCVLRAIEDGVAVLAVELLEERVRLRIGLERPAGGQSEGARVLRAARPPEPLRRPLSHAGRKDAGDARARNSELRRDARAGPEATRQDSCAIKYNVPVLNETPLGSTAQAERPIEPGVDSRPRAREDGRHPTGPRLLRGHPRLRRGLRKSGKRPGPLLADSCTRHHLGFNTWR